jgi:hypothetical protein
VTRHHQRFALRDVLFAGVSFKGATIDTWEDDQGRPQWSARVVGRFGDLEPSGELSGRMRSGQRVGGHVVTDASMVGRDSRERIVEFHGAGALGQIVEPGVGPPTSR